MEQVFEMDNMSDAHKRQENAYFNVTQHYPKKGLALKDFPTAWYLIVLSCTCLWAFNGGFINGICFAGPWHAGLTHVTGSVTLSGNRIIISPTAGQYHYYEYLSFVLSFGIGAIFTGFILGTTWLRWGKLQSVLCLIQGLLLILAVYLSHHFTAYLSGVVISFAMGLQNTLTSLFAPMTLRTSHVSGTVVDIGMTIGQMVRTRSLDLLWKIKIHAPTLLSYWIGAVSGTAVYSQWGNSALYVNATACLALAVFSSIATFTPWCNFSEEHQDQLQQQNAIFNTEHKNYGSTGRI